MINVEMSNIAQRLGSIYREYRYGNITSERAIKSIIYALDTLNYVSETEYNKKYFAEITKKGIRCIIRIDPSSKQTYKFLEECVVVSNLDLNARYKLFTILEQNFPKKVQNIREFLLTHASGYFPENITHNNGVFQGTNIIKAGLSQFLFKTYKILKEYGEFVFNNNYQGFSSGNCLIVNIKRDMYQNEKYIVRFPYANRADWKIEGYGSSYYLIDNKYKIGVKDLIFAINLLKKADIGFDEYKLYIKFSNDIETPTQIDYEGSNIKIYFFQSIKNES